MGSDRNILPHICIWLFTRWVYFIEKSWHNKDLALLLYSYIKNRLYDSTVCRLCGVDNSEGINLYDPNNETDFKTVINRYLPLKVEDDGKMPCTICPGCHIHLASTTQFFNLMVKGQAKLRHLWNQEMEFYKKIKKKALSSVVGSAYDILVLPDNPFYPDDHEFSLLVEGLIQPKRKRGRPRKTTTEQESAPEIEANTSSERDISPSSNSKGQDEELGKRKRKLPQRLKETVAGNELEKILLAEGAIDEFEVDAIQCLKESSQGNDRSVVKEIYSPPGEVIGHLQTPDGKIAEPILSQAHGRTTSRRKKLSWSCNFCQQTFREKSKWIIHRRTHEGLNMQCGDHMCWEMFNNKSKFVAHQMATKHSGMHIVNVEVASTDNASETVCEICGYLAESCEILEKHIENDHTETKEEINEVPLQNTLSPSFNFEPIKIEPLLEDADISENPLDKPDDGQFSTSTTRNKMTGKFECNICKRSFNHSSSLVYHKESCHNNGIRFACSKCSKSFSHRQLLQRHQMVHSDFRPFSCTKCGVGFKSKSNLYNHQVVHSGEKKFSCSICDQRFSHKTSLNLHAVLHQGIRPYKCPKCPKSFAQNGNLSEHLRIHYGSKPYACQHCGKAFTTSSQFKLHVKRHTGEKPWKCQYCDKQFLHKDTYVTHERRHTGEKPFICQFCPRAFAEQWSLKKHTRLHTGEKPYKCEHCGKMFADCSNLTKHKKVHGLTNNANTQYNSIQDYGMESDKLQRVIYVIKQANEGDQPVNISESKQLNDDIGEETGQWTTLTDEQGDELIVPLPDGRTFQIVSIDMDTNEVQIRISDCIFLVQLAEPPDITNGSLMAQIRDIVMRMKLPTNAESGKAGKEASGFDDELPLDYINKVQQNSSNSIVGENQDTESLNVEIKSRFAEHSEEPEETFPSALDHKSFSSEFPIYLVQ